MHRVIMGTRNCAEASCNALEFRSSGYCLRHKDDHPWMTPSEPALEVVPASKEELKKAEGDFSEGPLVTTLLILGWLFPPILLLIIPYYMFNRSTSKEHSEPNDGNLDAKSHRGEGIPIAGENPEETELPWWEGLESESN